MKYLSNFLSLSKVSMCFALVTIIIIIIIIIIIVIIIIITVISIIIIRDKDFEVERGLSQIN